MKSISVVSRIFIVFIFFYGQCYSNSKSIVGKVVDKQSHKPIPSCIIMFSNNNKILGITESDSSGYFAINNVSSDKVTLKALRTGYETIITGPILISKLDTLKMLIELEEKVIVLPEIIVEDVAEDKLIVEKGFWERKEKLTGQFLTYKELKGRVFNKSSELLQSLPGIHVMKRKIRREDGRMETVDFISSARSHDTAVNIYLDGIPFDNDGSIDNLNPYDIAAVEYYSSTANAPMAYGGAFRSGGVLLIWTKK